MFGSKYCTSCLTHGTPKELMQLPKYSVPGTPGGPQGEALTNIPKGKHVVNAVTVEGISHLLAYVAVNKSRCSVLVWDQILEEHSQEMTPWWPAFHRKPIACMQFAVANGLFIKLPALLQAHSHQLNKYGCSRVIWEAGISVCCLSG